MGRQRETERDRERKGEKETISEKCSSSRDRDKISKIANTRMHLEHNLFINNLFDGQIPRRYDSNHRKG